MPNEQLCALVLCVHKVNFQNLMDGHVSKCHEGSSDRRTRDRSLRSQYRHERCCVAVHHLLPPCDFCCYTVRARVACCFFLAWWNPDAGNNCRSITSSGWNIANRHNKPRPGCTSPWRAPRCRGRRHRLICISTVGLFKGKEETATGTGAQIFPRYGSVIRKK